MPEDDMDKYYDAMDDINKFKLGELTGKKIIEAVKRNDVGEVKRLINLPAEEGGLIILRYTMKDKEGKTALQIAEKNNSNEIIKILK